MTKTIRVGMMPGRIEEFAVEVGCSVASVLELAGLSTTGYEVKIDGNTTTDLNSPITESTNLILLAKLIKGNADKMVRVGMMPGRISEFAVTTDMSIAQVLELADLNASGYDVKIDGNTTTNLEQPVAGANLILLAKQIKGN